MAINSSKVKQDVIPFNRPGPMGHELAYLQESLNSGHISGDGPFSKKCHAFFEKEFGIKKALLTTSCTHALEMAALLTEVGPGDEVIIPSFTFVSTANAFVLRGATPVFADIDRETLNIDPDDVDRLITPRTKVIVPVHYGGVGCQMERLQAIAQKHNIILVEDNAHGLFGKRQGRWLGTIAPLATQSFHETKNIISGEGGALFINDEKWIERAEILREKGTNRSRFFRGQIDKYTWVDLGSSYLPSDLIAAVLLAQLECAKVIQQRRLEIWQGYLDGLSGWARENGVQTPLIPEDCDHPAHMFFLLLPDLFSRDAFISHMRLRGVACVFHYVPLHSSPQGRKLANRLVDCPVSQDISERLVRLPLYPGLKEAEFDRVLRAAREFRAAKIAV